MKHGLTAIRPCRNPDAFYARLGFVREGGGGADYRMLRDPHGATIHLRRAGDEAVATRENPFGLYFYTDEVDALAAVCRASVIEPTRASTNKP